MSHSGEDESDDNGNEDDGEELEEKSHVSTFGNFVLAA